jgi:outer membrane protein TolC
MPFLVVVPCRVRGALFVLMLPMSVAALPPVSSASAAESVLTLDQAVQRAVERAPSLLARRARTRAAEEETHSAAALPDPKLTFGGRCVRARPSRRRADRLLRT